MSMSYVLCPHLIRSKPGRGKRLVLVTGAAGHIGRYFSQHASSKYELRLLDRNFAKFKEAEQYGKPVTAELSDIEALKNACEGVDTVLHLAGDPNPGATWDSLRESNVLGTYNLFVAAKAAGVRRVVYASSIHAVSGYPADMQVKTSDPVNPGDLYGVSKCFGEALARYMAEQEGLSAICIRIGAFQPEEKARSQESIGMMDAWVSQRDLQQLIEKCIDDDRLQFAIFHGLSDNRFKRLDISSARELLLYAPKDDLTEVNPKLAPLHLKGQVNEHGQRDGQKSGIREDLE